VIDDGEFCDSVQKVYTKEILTARRGQ